MHQDSAHARTQRLSGNAPYPSRLGPKRSCTQIKCMNAEIAMPWTNWNSSHATLIWPPRSTAAKPKMAWRARANQIMRQSDFHSISTLLGSIFTLDVAEDSPSFSFIELFKTEKNQAFSKLSDKFSEITTHHGLNHLRRRHLHPRADRIPPVLFRFWLLSLPSWLPHLRWLCFPGHFHPCADNRRVLRISDH